MANYLLCGCGHQVDTEGKPPGEVIACPGCGCQMVTLGGPAGEFVDKLLSTPNKPGVFAHVRLDDAGSPPHQPAKPVGWFRRILQRLGMG